MQHDKYCLTSIAKPHAPAGKSRVKLRTGIVQFHVYRVDMKRLRQSFSRSVYRHGCHRAFVALLMLAANASMAADSPVQKLDVTFEGDAYIVNAIFIAPAPKNIAWDVLTDFDHLAQWVPNVTESKATKREDAFVTVEQKGVAKYGAASFPYTSERRIELRPPSAIKTAQIKGNMRRVESSIMLETEGNTTRIVYHLEIVPSAFAGAVMSKKFVEHEIGEQFTAIVGEMARRAK